MESDLARKPLLSRYFWISHWGNNDDIHTQSSYGDKKKFILEINLISICSLPSIIPSYLEDIKKIEYYVLSNLFATISIINFL